jgi:S-adenosylmethionine-diacylglycerol 3-amino-3-carboxypropyl transferase
MKPLFGFGFSQEDELTVASRLDIEGESVLCVASGGDIPLSLLARGARKVLAVDISEEQLHLCRLKVAALKRLDPQAAAGLLGFLPASASQRRAWWASCGASLPEPAAAFWRVNERALSASGAIWCGRYEQFILKLQWVIRPLLGRAFKALSECSTLAEQEVIFDLRIGRRWLRSVFRLAFSRKVYAGHGIDEQGLANRTTSVPLGEQYWSKLRSFCTANLARRNPWLQIHTLGRLLTMEAAPHYLGEGFDSARQRVECVEWIQSDLLEYVKRSLPRDVTRVYLSNLPDWYSASDFEELVRALTVKLPSGARVLWSALHTEWQVPADLLGSVVVESLASPVADRFPFYAFTGLHIR